MNKVIKTISISRDVDDIIQNISKNFFKNDYYLALESVVKSADANNIEIAQEGEIMNFHSLKAVPSGINSIDFKKSSL